jgi:hypothetical protein
VVQFAVTDSTPNRFISAVRPYGFGRFGQAGLRLSLHYDVRDRTRGPHRGLLTDLSGDFYPAVWDVTSPFGEITGRAVAFLAFPIPAHPILFLGGGATKVFGRYPFHEAAFIGGRTALPSLDAERYAGDASLYGTTELRLSLARFAFVLPLDVGVFGALEVGRVYVDGASPGGWHIASGVGFWIGVLDQGTVIRACGRPGRGGPC